MSQEYTSATADRHPVLTPPHSVLGRRGHCFRYRPRRGFVIALGLAITLGLAVAAPSAKPLHRQLSRQLTAPSKAMRLPSLSLADYQELYANNAQKLSVEVRVENTGDAGPMYFVYMRPKPGIYRKILSYFDGGSVAVVAYPVQ